MATVKVKRVDVITRLEEVLGQADGTQKDVATPEEVERAIRDAEYSLARNEQQLLELQRYVKNCKADLRSLRSTKPLLRVVRKYVGRQSDRFMSSWAKGEIRGEIRLLKLSDEEFIRIGTKSNIAQYI